MENVRPDNKPVPTDAEIKKHGYCRICKLGRLISTTTPGIVRVQCADYIDFKGEKQGKTCKEFEHFPGLQECDLYCPRFVRCYTWYQFLFRKLRRRPV